MLVLRSRTGGAIDPDNMDRAFKRHLTAAGLHEGVGSRLDRILAPGPGRIAETPRQHW